MVESSQRERSRVRRRTTIERAAMRLFAERGYDATTIADIATAADVAPRTVPLYFPTKIDLALAYTDAAAVRMMDVVESLGDGETVLDSLARFVRHEWLHESEALALHRAMLLTNVALRGAHSSVVAQAILVTRAKLARDVGRPFDDVIVTLVGASIEGVVRALLELDPSSHDVDATFDAAMRLLESAVHSARAEPAAISG